MRTDDELLNEIETANDGEGPDPILSVGPDLARLAAANLQAQAADRALDEAVAAARASGQTWQAIGTTLGMSKQNASKRFTRRIATASAE